MYLGFINGPLFLVICIFLIGRAKKFNCSLDPVCKLGSLKETEKVFNAALITFSVGQIIIVITMINVFGSSFISLSLWLLVISSMAGLLAGIITMKRNLKIHIMLARFAFFMTVFGGLLYGTFLLQNNLALAIKTILISITTGLLLIFYSKSKRVAATAEIIFFLSLSVWDILNTIYLVSSK